MFIANQKQNVPNLNIKTQTSIASPKKPIYQMKFNKDADGEEDNEIMVNGVLQMLGEDNDKKIEFAFKDRFETKQKRLRPGTPYKQQLSYITSQQTSEYPAQNNGPKKRRKCDEKQV